MPVVLATINARYAHASLGLRYLLANGGRWRDRTALVEGVCGGDPEALADRILTYRPRVVGLGIYIWNVRPSETLIETLRRRDPALTIVLGGPEVSHEADRQRICALADHVIQGPGEIAWPRLLDQLLLGPRPLMKVIAGEQPDLAALALPYRCYSDRDLRERVVYVEASRGCPFKCAFCLSALDRTAWPFPLAPLLDELDRLHRRGARRFKFVDRTFNLKPATSVAILGFFLERIEARPDDPCFVHFELIPDHLPVALQALIPRFPRGTLQFEIGIQTFDPAVQQRIDRRQHNDRAEANLRWLIGQSQAHLHVDLIAGLPGETLAGFAAGFDRLAAIGPDEIQLGLLKRLRGTPLADAAARHGLEFDPEPPYTVRSTGAMSADEIALLGRIARTHDRVVNSGRMPALARLVLGDAPFARLRALAEALQDRFGRGHAIGFEALIEAVVDWLAARGEQPREAIEALARQDYRASGAHGRLAFMARGVAPGDAARRRAAASVAADAAPSAALPRQVRRLATMRDQVRSWRTASE